MTDAEFEEQIVLYALGVLEPAQTALVEADLHNNPHAQVMVVRWLESVAVLAQSAPIQVPHPSLKSKLAERVKLRKRKKPDFFLPVLVWLARGFSPVAVTTVCALCAVLLVVNQQHTQALQTNRQQMQRLESLLASSQTKAFLMQAPITQNVVGRVYLANGQVLISHSMGVFTGLKTWQVWYIQKGQARPRSLGTTTTAHLMVGLPRDAVVVAISEEPLGGSRQPTLIRGVAKL
jgi:anti-sigma-K factor RskA